MMVSLSTIHFYIILKLTASRWMATCSLSTIHFYIILKHYMIETGEPYLFEYHTFLHHSQTVQLEH